MSPVAKRTYSSGYDSDQSNTKRRLRPRENLPSVQEVGGRMQSAIEPTSVFLEAPQNKVFEETPVSSLVKVLNAENEKYLKNIQAKLEKVEQTVDKLLLSQKVQAESTSTVLKTF